MITIHESGMAFGPYEDDRVYHVERSSLYQGISAAKTVEFILAQSEDALLFVEAKSSSPKPVVGNRENFQDYSEDIAEKFLHSLNLFCAALLGRHDLICDMPDSFRAMDSGHVSIKFLLVINGHPAEWLPPIQTALDQKLRSYRSIWGSEVVVLNHEMALRRHLIQPPA